ncbi:uncharacterized protein EV422DRAFT_145797 [Fimicolochytrium jonesii]|uniref:uncharacterized protein n=1 Tax=Fimicolochytrium jonesii TaxID=1396493 RepID=UPI0022FF1FE4|nr:uncharacterized protein EV422DRAFT_145797 [Fimicolochytrium jonesii]KAI8825909.1 hypothetical protein EV422DRAFT_145797 [Fimicolochytrium jonesii]
MAKHLAIQVQPEDLFSDGLSLLKALSTHRYDLILLDIDMPVLDGLQATFKIRNPGQRSDSASVRSAIREGPVTHSTKLTSQARPVTPSPTVRQMRYAMTQAGGDGLSQEIEDWAANVLDANRRTPIIAITANGFLDEQRRHCLAVGMNEVLSKPVSPETLKNVVQRYVDDEDRDFNFVHNEPLGLVPEAPDSAGYGAGAHKAKLTPISLNEPALGKALNERLGSVSSSKNLAHDTSDYPSDRAHSKWDTERASMSLPRGFRQKTEPSESKTRQPASARLSTLAKGELRLKGENSIWRSCDGEDDGDSLASKQKTRPSTAQKKENSLWSATSGENLDTRPPSESRRPSPKKGGSLWNATQSSRRPRANSNEDSGGIWASADEDNHSDDGRREGSLWGSAPGRDPTDYPPEDPTDYPTPLPCDKKRFENSGNSGHSGESDRDSPETSKCVRPPTTEHGAGGTIRRASSINRRRPESGKAVERDGQAAQ